MTMAGMGEDLLDQAIFLELMVFLNRAFAARCTDAAAPAPAPSSNYHAQVDAILSYINSHIGEPLTLAGLSAHFFRALSISVPYFQGGHRHHHQQIHHRKAHHPVQIAARSGLLRLGSLRGLRLQRLQQLSACLHKSSRHLSEKVRTVSLLRLCTFPLSSHI